MRILLMMDPFIRIPPTQYGGIERTIADLIEGLARRGHAVTLWAAPGSRTAAHLEAFGHEGEWTRWSNIRNVLALGGRFWTGRQRFDVIHNVGRLAYLAPILRADIPKVQSYHRIVNPRNMRIVSRLGARRLRFTAVSRATRDTGRTGGGKWTVIGNGVAPERFPFNSQVDASQAPLMFLGRLDRCKGAHTAIAVARRVRRRLVIAGNVSELPHERAYFEKEIAPHIDGAQVTYVGPVDDAAKSRWLSCAAGLLMPVECEEAFGLVMVEALMTGTPVIAFKRGGIPEVIEHGQTGFLCETPTEMAGWVERLPAIDRTVCRAAAERRFSSDAVVSAYEQLYEEMIGSDR